jgi:DNA-binding NarL/FixJ family response regulator
VTDPVIRVLVADDHAIVRTGIRHVLETAPGFSVVGEAANGTEALALALELKPDVAVLDISMPGVSGLEAAAVLRERLPDTRVLMLSMHDNTEYVLESLRAGVHGYILKDSAAQELSGAIRAVCRGESFFSPPIAKRLGAVVRGELGREPAGALAQLTARERQVLQLAAQGLRNREVAERLGISPRTAESHRAKVMSKLGLRREADLVRFALRHGILPLEREAASLSPAG